MHYATRLTGDSDFFSVSPFRPTSLTGPLSKGHANFASTMDLASEPSSMEILPNEDDIRNQECRLRSSRMEPSTTTFPLAQQASTFCGIDTTSKLSNEEVQLSTRVYSDEDTKVNSYANADAESASESAGFSNYETAAPSIAESDPPRIRAFAKLDFEDGEFYMNTYSVELGRDLRSAARLAHERETEGSQGFETRSRKRSDSGGEASQSSTQPRRDETRNLASSVISESGGIVGLGAQDGEPGKKFRGNKSKSTNSSSQKKSRKEFTNYQALAMASLMDGDYGVSPLPDFLPIPHEACPLLPIHPPAMLEGVPAGQRSISRKHVRISFNFEKRLFEATILGRNGAFVDDQWYPRGDIQTLRSGYWIQVGGVRVRFLLPEVPLGATGAEVSAGSDPTSGGKMSFEFEDGRGERNLFPSDSSDFTSSESEDEDEDEDEDDGEDEDEGKDEDEVEDEGEGDEEAGDTSIYPDDELGEIGDDEEEGEDRMEDIEQALTKDDSVDEEPEEVAKPIRTKKVTKAKVGPNVKAKPKSKVKPKVTAKAKVKAIVKPEPVPKPAPVAATPGLPRKGPGRPPKNGIMSKREQALLARQAREAAKAAALEASGGQSEAGKGTDTNGAILENGTGLNPNQPPAKRKYTKRKSKDAQPGEEQADLLASGQGYARTLKDKRPPKPPRSPSPVYDESKMTPEQLAKPQQSYVMILHDVIMNSPTRAMSLPQLYRAMERKYPFFKLRTSTNGWQSSVRHNLSQHCAFKKIERDGKGWMWGIDPAVPIEKERKRKPTPPLVPQHYYQQNHVMPHASPPGMAPPNGQMAHPPNGQMANPPNGQMANPPNGQMAHPPNGQIAHPPKSQRAHHSHSGGHILHGLPHPALGPNGLPIPFVAAQPDPNATYQSPYGTQPPQPPQPLQSPQPPQPPQPSQLSQPSEPSRPSQTPQPSQNPQPAYTTGSSGHHAPNQPPSVGENPGCNPSHQASYPVYLPQHPVPVHNPSNRLTNSAADKPTSVGNYSAEVLEAISKFRQDIINSMDDKQAAVALASSAIARTIDPQLPSSGKSQNTMVEQEMIRNLTLILDKIHKRSPSQLDYPSPVSSTPHAHDQASSNSNSLSSPQPETLPAHQQTDTSDPQQPQPQKQNRDRHPSTSSISALEVAHPPNKVAEQLIAETTAPELSETTKGKRKLVEVSSEKDEGHKREKINTTDRG